MYYIHAETRGYARLAVTRVHSGVFFFLGCTGFDRVVSSSRLQGCKVEPSCSDFDVGKRGSEEDNSLTGDGLEDGNTHRTNKFHLTRPPWISS
jgi:hypothetical protein